MNRRQFIIFFLFAFNFTVHAQQSTWIFSRNSWYTWDQYKSTKYYKLTFAKEDVDGLTLCTMSKGRFAFGKLVLVNYEPFTQSICKNPLLGVKTVYMKGYASVDDPLFRKSIDLKGTSTLKVHITMFLNEENYITGIIFNFEKKAQTFCVFQNEEIAQAFWNN